MKDKEKDGGQREQHDKPSVHYLLDPEQSWV